MFEVSGAPHLMVVNGSRVYGLDPDTAAQAASAIENGSMSALLARIGLGAPPYVEDEPPSAFPTRAISLAIAQKCNLACTYCYAHGGDFGGPAKSMRPEIAVQAVERLIDETPPGEPGQHRVSRWRAARQPQSPRRDHRACRRSTRPRAR